MKRILPVATLMVALAACQPQGPISGASTEGALEALAQLIRGKLAGQFEAAAFEAQLLEDTVIGVAEAMGEKAALSESEVLASATLIGAAEESAAIQSARAEFMARFAEYVDAQIVISTTERAGAASGATLAQKAMSSSSMLDLESLFASYSELAAQSALGEAEALPMNDFVRQLQGLLTSANPARRPVLRVVSIAATNKPGRFIRVPVKFGLKAAGTGEPVTCLAIIEENFVVDVGGSGVALSGKDIVRRMLVDFLSGNARTFARKIALKERMNAMRSLAKTGLGLPAGFADAAADVVEGETAQGAESLAGGITEGGALGKQAGAATAPGPATVKFPTTSPASEMTQTLGEALASSGAKAESRISEGKVASAVLGEVQQGNPRLLARVADQVRVFAGSGIRRNKNTFALGDGWYLLTGEADVFLRVTETGAAGTVKRFALYGVTNSRNFQKVASEMTRLHGMPALDKILVKMRAG